MTTEEVIEQSIISGNILKLPDVQLDRKQYMEVKTKLELIGGKQQRDNRRGNDF